jgi:adenine-specific DNA-methyltransferase
MIETIKYMGSKRKLLSHIDSIISSLNITKVLDGFSGSTIVSQMLSQKNYVVHCNDIAPYSKNFGITHLIENKNDSYYLPIIKTLNNLEPVDGWFTESYSNLNYKRVANIYNGSSGTFLKMKTLTNNLR